MCSYFFHSSHRELLFVLVIVTSHQSSALVIWSIPDGLSTMDAEKRCHLIHWLVCQSPPSCTPLPYSSSHSGKGDSGHMCIYLWSLWVRHTYIVLMSAILLLSSLSQGFVKILLLSSPYLVLSSLEACLQLVLILFSQIPAKTSCTPLQLPGTPECFWLRNGRG